MIPIQYFDSQISGLYLRKDRRLMCTVKTSDGKKTSVSFPKALMELYLGYLLDKDYTIDHIDMNPLNNNLSNLNIVNRKEHCKLDVLRNKDVELKCFLCGKTFIKKGSMLNNIQRKDKKGQNYFCSKTCSGKYGAMIQNGYKFQGESPKFAKQKETLKLSAQREISDVELLKFGEVLDQFKDRLVMIIPSQASTYLFTDKLRKV